MLASNEPGFEAFLKKLRMRDLVSPQEEAILRDLPSVVKTAPRRTTVIRAGHQLEVSTLLLSGTMCRYCDMRDGSRQISEVHIPGDFLDLHSFTLKRLDHSIMAITDCRFAEVPHSRLREITETAPHLTRMLWTLTNMDAAIHREWVVSLGRREALPRLAHFFCETYVRMNVIDRVRDGTYLLGMTQAELSESLGLTAVHVNRTMKRLRDLGLAEFRDGEVTVFDFDALAQLAEFNPDYLSLFHTPR